MTIASTTSRNDYTGSDVVGVYAYSFRIFADTDLLITVRSISTGVETTLVKGTDYTVDGVGVTSGGNATLVNAAQAWLKSGTAFLSSAYKMTIRRVRPLTQGTNLRNQGEYFAEIHEDSFDHDIMVTQQQQDDIDRSIKLPETVSGAGFSTLLPANIASSPGAGVIVNPAGNGFALGLTSLNIALLFGNSTYAQLKAAAAAAPTQMRMGWATDIRQFVVYVTDASIGDGGWVVLGGG